MAIEQRGPRVFNPRAPLLAFRGLEPVAMPPDYTGTSVATSRSHTAATSSAVATTGALNVAPFGYSTAAQADAIPAAINAIRTDIANVKAVVNQLIADLEAVGLVNRA